MSSFNAPDGHGKKLGLAKEKKELADKAFQSSDTLTGTSSNCVWSKVAALPNGEDSSEVLPRGECFNP